MTNAIVSTYRKLTHKNPSYNRDDAFKEEQKINDWLSYGSLRGLANVTEKEMMDENSEMLKRILIREQELLKCVLPETHNIEAHRWKLNRFITTKIFPLARGQTEYSERVIKSVREQTEDELKKSDFNYCQGYKHPKLEEIDSVARIVEKRNNIVKMAYAILEGHNEKLRELESEAMSGNADSKLASITKEFETNIELFESGLLNDTDKRLAELYMLVSR